MSVSACRFPARRDAANDTDLCPTPARHAPAALAYLFLHPSRFPLPRPRLARAGDPREGPVQVHLPSLASLLCETNVASLPDPTHAMSPSRRAVSRCTASRLVSTSSASSGSRGCHRQQLSIRVKIITLKERIGYGLRIFHTFARGFPSVRRPL